MWFRHTHACDIAEYSIFVVTNLFLKQRLWNIIIPCGDVTIGVG